MKTRITYRTQQFTVDEEFSGATPDAVVSEMQKAVAARTNFAVRLVVNTMSPLQFAREVVRRYNAATGRSIPSPGSCAEFIQLGESEGIVTVLDR